MGTRRTSHRRVSGEYLQGAGPRAGDGESPASLALVGTPAAPVRPDLVDVMVHKSVAFCGAKLLLHFTLAGFRRVMIQNQSGTALTCQISPHPLKKNTEPETRRCQ